ncbi:hypothetical protein VNO77_19748 [Canavalia gladiata]|uniref:Uncharacterized protein n=1 Tax=Canavalia gladiata TaxID=3824 RepID=A0AAN9LNA1_CANGL
MFWMTVGRPPLGLCHRSSMNYLLVLCQFHPKILCREIAEELSFGGLAVDPQAQCTQLVSRCTQDVFAKEEKALDNTTQCLDKGKSLDQIYRTANLPHAPTQLPLKQCIGMCFLSTQNPNSEAMFFNPQIAINNQKAYLLK